jgi:uridine kinase
VSKELNAVFEQVAQCCGGLELEGRAVILGVNGLDAGGNASFVKGLKAHLASAGKEVAVFHLEECADATARQEILAAGPDFQRYCDESIDYDLARQSIKELTAESGVLIAEGIFLYTGALLDLFDLRIYLDVEPANARVRLEGGKSAAGDGKSNALFDSLIQPAFELYLREYAPMASADLVVDINDARKPRVVSTVG